MRLWGCMVTFLALVVLVLPGLGAQDEDKKNKADEKKDVAKKDEEKKKEEDKKKDEKKPDEKPKKPAKEKEEKLVYERTISTKISRFDSENAGIFYIQMPQFDPEKVAGFQNRLAQNPGQSAQIMQEFMRAKATGGLMSLKDYEIRIGDKCKVRSLMPPQVFDDKGNLKRMGAKELAALRGSSKLPGYPVEQDALKPGQFVTVYLAKEAKSAPTTKTKTKTALAKKSKIAVDDDDAMMGTKAPEAVLIVIQAEAPNR